MKLGDKYYTGREVQEKLSITEPALRNLVNQKKIKKIVPPGRQYGVYLKQEIDRFAEKWEAFLSAKEPPKTIFRVATIGDIAAEQQLGIRAIGTNGMPVETKRAWFIANGESDYHVYHNNKLVAFLFFVPIRHAIIDQFMQGVIHWRDLNPETDIMQYKAGEAVDLFVQGIASDPDATKAARMHYMFVLLRGTGEALKQLGMRGIIFRKVYARSQTVPGIAMAIHAGMKEYEPMPTTGKLTRFVLDVTSSHSFLAHKYKEGLAEWQEQQRKSV